MLFKVNVSSQQEEIGGMPDLRGSGDDSSPQIDTVLDLEEWFSGVRNQCYRNNPVATVWTIKC